MELDVISVAIGIGVGALGLMSGYKRRYQSHQMRIRRDLLFLAIVFCEFLAIVFCAIIENSTIAILGGIFLFFYFIAYRTADPRDWIGIYTCDEYMGKYFARELIHFIKNDIQCTTGQDLRSAIKNVMGIYDTLDADLSSIKRTMESSFSKKGRKKRSINAAAVSKYDITDISEDRIKFGSRKIRVEDGSKVRVPRYLMTARSQNHEVIFADCATTDPITFDTSVEFRKEILDLYIKEQQKNRRLEVLNSGLRFECAAELLEGIFELDLDRIGIEKDVLDGLAEEMINRRNISATAAKLAMSNRGVIDDGDKDEESDGVSG